MQMIISINTAIFHEWGIFIILIQKRYQDNADEINEEDIDSVKLNLLTITRKVCCGGRDKKDYDLGWVENPKDMKITTVKDYEIKDRVPEVWMSLEMIIYFLFRAEAH